MKRVVALMLVVLLGGCSWQSSPEVEQPWTSWQCDSQVQFSWRYRGPAHDRADVRLTGSERLYALAAVNGADGESFTDGVLVFHKKGDEGLIYWAATNDLIGRGCKAP